MYSVLGNHKTMTHRYTVNVIHIYRGIIVFTQQKPKNKKKPFRFSAPPLQIPGHATDIHIAIIIV